MRVRSVSKEIGPNPKQYDLPFKLVLGDIPMTDLFQADTLGRIKPSIQKTFRLSSRARKDGSWELNVPSLDPIRQSESAFTSGPSDYTVSTDLEVPPHHETKGIANPRPNPISLCPTTGGTRQETHSNPHISYKTPTHPPRLPNVPANHSMTR